jgi:hypothetical protein
MLGILATLALLSPPAPAARAGSLRVEGRPGLAEVRVSGVRGGFTVESDGSGAIRYGDVAGAVRIPPRRRGR